MKVQPGDIVLFRDLDSFDLAKVQLVREDRVTGFPWQDGERRFARRNRRIALDRLVCVLPADGCPIAAAREIAVLRNRRDIEKRQAQARFVGRIREIIAGEAP